MVEIRLFLFHGFELFCSGGNESKTEIFRAQQIQNVKHLFSHWIAECISILISNRISMNQCNGLPIGIDSASKLYFKSIMMSLLFLFHFISFHSISFQSIPFSEPAVNFSHKIFESSTISFREITQSIASLRESHRCNYFRDQTFCMIESCIKLN
jgi:hypothetical protein